MTDLKEDLAALRIERAPERSGVPRLIRWVLALIVVAGLTAGGWRWATRERPIEVEAATVAERASGTQAAVLNASGYVTARRRATISSKITGKVVEVNVEEGMAVKEGQVLARLDDANPRAALAFAEAQAEAARRNIAENEVRLADARVSLGRKMQLVKERVVAQSEVDTSQADVDSIAARIAAAREMVSPVSAGGGFTRTGICTIVDMKSLEIDVDVNESYINRVVGGQDVTAVLNAYPDWQIPARVITMVPTADRQKATVLVRIGFKQLDPRILPDMGVKVTFLAASANTANPADAQRRPTLLVPKTAVRSENGQSVVFVVRSDNIVERRAVKTAGEDGSQLEVVAGLTSRESVVTSASPGLKDGMRVSIKSNP